jgi:citrate synthase
VAGWLAQWQEMLEDPEQKIARPRQVYIGKEVRHVNGKLGMRAVAASD